MDRRATQLLQKGQDLLSAGQLEQAVSCLAEAAELSPDSPDILTPLAEARLQQGEYIPALQAYDRIIELGAATAATWLATGNALADVGEHAQAIGAFEQSLGMDATNPEAHHNLARACYRMGEVSRAGQHLELALQHQDTLQSWQSLATLAPAWPEADHNKILQMRRRFAKKLAKWTGVPMTEDKQVPKARGHDGPLRIGYVCAFFHQANYTKPVWGLINHHDRSKYQLHLFSDSPLEQGLPCYEADNRDQIHDVRQLDNQQLAELVRSQQIDILVDLNAYSYEPRLSLYLNHPAPVTVAWWAMYATSGLPGIDYLIGDDEMIRPQEEAYFSERVLRLPVSYLTFTVDYPVPPVVPPPCLQHGYFTFGTLVTQYKITPQVMDAWAALLRGAADARLVLANLALKSPHNRQYVCEQFRRREVDPDRLTLHGPADHATYLRHYDKIDLALDSFPYNGGTTTMEAIWQGVPVLTFDGDRWISRTSQTLLRRCHLGQFVASDAEDMVDRGLSWACDPTTWPILAELRAAMRERLAASSACNTPALARGMEQIYDEIWASATTT